MKEIKTTSHKDEPLRRWFSDDYFDLIVWFSVTGDITGFQLCYDKNGQERTLTWTDSSGFRHDQVDSGEESPTKNQAPVLMPVGNFPRASIVDQFTTRSAAIDQQISTFVSRMLQVYRD